MDISPPAPLPPDSDPIINAHRLDRAIFAGIRYEAGDASLWLPALAAERLALGVVQSIPQVGESPFEARPFDICLFAASNGRADALDLLLDLGYAPCPTPADQEERGYSWTDLLHACSERGLCRAIERLVKTTPIDAPLCDWTPLLRAASNEQEEAALLLLRLGADPLAATPDGESALILAAMRDLPTLAHALLCSGADPHILDKSGRGALGHAREHKAHGFLAAVDAFELARATPVAPAGRRPGL